jgi:hypothetical protein
MELFALGLIVGALLASLVWRALLQRERGKRRSAEIKLDGARKALR